MPRVKRKPLPPRAGSPVLRRARDAGGGPFHPDDAPLARQREAFHPVRLPQGLLQLPSDRVGELPQMLDFLRFVEASRRPGARGFQRVAEIFPAVDGRRAVETPADREIQHRELLPA